MLDNGLDSAFAPTQQQVEAAKSQGYVWWGFYLPPEPNTDPLNSWTIAQVDLLKNVGIQPVPICVPAPPHPADPVALATGAFHLAQQYGLSPKVAVCYNGEHISVAGPVWLPIPGSRPTSIGAGSAIQYGQGSLEGLSVDFNASATDFPKALGLVCDLEHNATYDSEWYKTFQDTVTQLANESSSITVPPTNVPVKPTSEVPVNVPVLSQTNPGPTVVNQAVKSLQALLKMRIAPNLTIDGRFGRETASAVAAWERARGITVDTGIAGPQVWQTLTTG